MNCKEAIEYLEQNSIRMVMKPEGYPALKGPAGMPDATLRKVIGYCSHVLEKYRDEIVIHFQLAGILPQGPIGKPPVGGIDRDPTQIYPDTPLAEQRRLLLVRFFKYLVQYSDTNYLVWFSLYTRETGRLFLSDVDRVPGHASRIGVVCWWGTHWVRLPGHSPPKYSVARKNKAPKVTWWKPPSGWKPPHDWFKPKGFKMDSAKLSQAARRKFWKTLTAQRDGSVPD